jgi:Tol biopolymer transport system component
MAEDPMRASDAPAGETPLESWKEIGAYLKRDVSTLKRWERGEGLPIHRHLHHARSSVYAYPSELDEWWSRRRPAEDARGSAAWMDRRRLRAAASTLVLVLALATVGDGRVLRPSARDGRESRTISRLIWTGPLVDLLGAPSPDGSYMAVTDWETGNLAIRETSTGAMRRLTDNDDWSGWAEFPVPSPDGRHVAYAWYNEKAEFDLRVYSLEAPSARVVYADDAVEYAQPFAWTPDGTRILASLSRTDRTTQIAFVAVADGSVRVLKAVGRRSPQKMALSPDGRYVAYDLPQEQGSPWRDVFLLAADGSREEVLVRHPDNDVVVGWTPDGKGLLFGSDRTGRPGIWELTMADGRAVGSPVLVRPDVPLLWAMGITRQGALYYSVRTGVSDVYLARLDPETGSVLSPPSPLTARFVGWNRSPDWSADGRFVAYVSQRDSLLRSPGWSGGTIVVRSLTTGEEQEIPPRLASMGSLRWSPDGRSFLVSGRDDRGRSGFFTLRADTGEATLVLNEEAPAQVQFPAWSPDGRSFYYFHTTPEARNRLRVRELGTGRDREVFSRSANNMAPSPDGRSVVVRFSDPVDRASVLALVSVGGGELRELVRVLPPGELPPWSGLAWTPDGKHVLFARTTDVSGQPFELWRIPLEGGAPLQTGIAMEGLRDLRVHPDGQQIAFRAGHGQGEVWVMEEFLPGTDR